MNEVIFIDKKKIKNNFYFLVMSLIVMLYIIFIVYPFGNESGAFSEGAPMNSSESGTLFTMSAPALFIYLLYALKIYKNLKYFNFLNYPLGILNICFLSVFTLLGVDGYGFLILFLILPIWCVIIFAIAMIFVGLYQDIISWKEYIESQNK